MNFPTPFSNHDRIGKHTVCNRPMGRRRTCKQSNFWSTRQLFECLMFNIIGAKITMANGLRKNVGKKAKSPVHMEQHCMIRLRTQCKHVIVKTSAGSKRSHKQQYNIGYSSKLSKNTKSLLKILKGLFSAKNLLLCLTYKLGKDYFLHLPSVKNRNWH